MRTSAWVALATFACSAFAAPSNTRRHAVHEKRDLDAHPEEWAKRDRAHPLQVLPMKIGLTQRNLEHAERFIMDVSDPASPNYGNHWTAEEVANMFMPSEETYDRVRDWVEDAGIHTSRISHSQGRNWLHFNATVEEAESLLKTHYHIYEHTHSSFQQAACDAYHVPEDIQHHIDFIMPTIQLDHLRQLGKRGLDVVDGPSISQARNRVPVTATFESNPGLTGLKNCSTLITIDCLRAIYKFPYLGTAHPANIMGIAEWSDYLYLPDLKRFFERYTKPVIPSDVQPDFLSIDGGKTSNKSVANKGEVVESGLDFQTAYSIIYPQKLRQYQMGDSVNVNSVGTFNIFLDALDASYCTYEGGDSKKHDPHYPDPKAGGYKGSLQCGGAPLSTVYSFSYLQTEAMLPPFYQHRQCNEYMKLGLQGVSFLFASGDSGVAMRYNAGFPNKCLDPHNTTQAVNATRFNPGFPATCPWVTAVGATDLLTNNITGGERAVNGIDKKNPELDFYSGGGFSNYFAVPSYQKSAVNHFLQTYEPKYGPDIFNQSGDARAYPDVASLGLNLAVVYLNQTIAVGGTSASTPTVASIVTLLNEKRMTAGKKSLGFLNPFIYANMDAFNDITVGGNPGCGSKGFNAQKGWDPVTGVGSPNWPKLLKAAMAMP